MGNKSGFPIVAASCAAGLLLAGFAAFAKWGGLNFSIDPGQLMNLMSPLLLAAGFIERAVEVLISPWRDADASKLQTALDQAKAATVPDAAAIKTASDALTEYRGETQRFAFLASMLLGGAAALVGVRALYPLLAAPKATGATWGQQTTFAIVDVFLSAVMLAGGADGLHSVITAFTGYFDATGEKARKSAAQ